MGLMSTIKARKAIALHNKGDLDGVTREMQAIAEAAPPEVTAELEIDPVNLF